MSAALDELDPFDLPAWLGEVRVVWHPETGIGDGPLLAGRLEAEAHEAVPCDLLAVDEAYPAPVADDTLRMRAHQAWRHGQVQLVSLGGRPTLLVPGRRFTADGVLETLARLARAVGGRPDHLAALLTVGRDRP